MIKNMERAILYNQKQEKCFERNRNLLPFLYHYQVLQEKCLNEISALYQSYNGCKEFLYIADKEEIRETLLSDKMCYMGMVSSDNQLVGVLKVKELEFPYPFFVVPKQEQNEQAKFFGISGLLVNPYYRKQGIAKHLVEETVRVLRRLGAKGVYADCDFRNEASFMTFSSQFNFVGFVDGRNGADNEKSIYLTFYYDLQEKSKRSEDLLLLDFSNVLSKDGIVNRMQDNMVDKLGNFSSYKIGYKDGYNKVCVLDSPVDIKSSKLMLGPYWKKTLQDFEVLENVSAKFLGKSKELRL